MKGELKFLTSAAIISALSIASPARATNYTCQDLYGAISAFDASLNAYDEANISSRNATLQDEWRICLSNSTVDAGLWCDQEYEANTRALFEEEQWLLLDIEVKRQEVDYITSTLGSEGIVCS